MNELIEAARAVIDGDFDLFDAVDNCGLPYQSGQCATALSNLRSALAKLDGGASK